MQIWHGQGIAGRFGGLPDPFGQEDFSKIVILPVPFDKTSTYQKGSAKGPSALIEASRNLELYDIETQSEIYQRGIYTDLPIYAESSEEMLNLVYRRVKELLELGKFVVTVGGEHSISYAPIRAHAAQYQSLTVLQLDAHADLQPAYENNPWSHACVMARVKEIPEVTQLFSVGIRSLSREELPFLDLTHVYFAHQLEGFWIDDLLQKLRGPVYITCDLDVLDSSLMPSTGTPEPGGLTWYTMTALLKRVFQEKEVVGFDLMELCPNPYNVAPDYLAAKLIYKMLSYQYG